MAHKPRARRYAVLSGKGGVGKSVITANLAAALARSGQQILVIDADMGLANLDVILGVNPAGTIQDILKGDLTITDVVLHTRGGFDLLPAGSATLEANPLTLSFAENMGDLLGKIEQNYDAIFFDVGAGIGEMVLFFARLADEIVLVVTPEPTSMMDAYATVKVLALRYGCTDIRLVVNQADSKGPEQSGLQVANHLQQVVSRFLSAECSAPVRLHLAGSLPVDPSVGKAIRQQQLLLEMDPHNPVAAMIPRLAQSLRTSIPERIP